MTSNHITSKSLQRGFTAVEVSIFMIAATVVATISAVALMTLSGESARAGAHAANRGLDHATGTVQLNGPVIATRGEVDVDGNDVIDLSGVDIEAIATLKMVLTADLSSGIDLTPPYTVDATGTDPDFSTTQFSTVVSVNTENFDVLSAAWSISFPGEDDGDFMLEKGERAEMTIWLMPEDLANGWFDLGTGASDPYIDSVSEALLARGHVTVRLTTDDAQAISISRTMPIELTSSILLE